GLVAPSYRRFRTARRTTLSWCGTRGGPSAALALGPKRSSHRDRGIDEAIPGRRPRGHAVQVTRFGLTIATASSERPLRGVGQRLEGGGPPLFCRGIRAEDHLEHVDPLDLGLDRPARVAHARDEVLDGQRD